MKKLFCCALTAAALLSACGYKGDLYLPREGDKARFGVIQTGLIESTPVTSPKEEKQK
ncbi:MAG: lipoprotein [Neisseria sp.]|nr:lipoprotein [Neisseria sp.]